MRYDQFGAKLLNYHKLVFSFEYNLFVNSGRESKTLLRIIPLIGRTLCYTSKRERKKRKEMLNRFQTEIINESK